MSLTPHSGMMGTRCVSVRDDGTIEIGEPREFGSKDWNRWASKLTAAIRQVHPGALVFVSGIDWGFDLRGVEIDSANVVYSAHVYPNRSRRHWHSRFGRRCIDHPLFIGEWGGEAGDLQWGSELISYLRKVAWLDSLELGGCAQACP